LKKKKVSKDITISFFIEERKKIVKRNELERKEK
jgi:hypothetical protein